MSANRKKNFIGGHFTDEEKVLIWHLAAKLGVSQDALVRAAVMTYIRAGQSQDMPDQYVNVKKAAELLGKSPSTINRMINRGELPCVEYEGHHDRSISLNDIKTYLSSHTKQKPATGYLTVRQAANRCHTASTTVYGWLRHTTRPLKAIKEPTGRYMILEEDLMDYIKASGFSIAESGDAEDAQNYNI